MRIIRHSTLDSNKIRLEIYLTHHLFHIFPPFNVVVSLWQTIQDVGAHPLNVHDNQIPMMMRLIHGYVNLQQVKWDRILLSVNNKFIIVGHANIKD